MLVNINLEIQRELNKILSMLMSSDVESKALGIELLLHNEFFNKTLINATYTSSRTHKEIPVSWYCRKANSLCQDKPNCDFDKTSNIFDASQLIIPLLKDLLVGAPCFRDQIFFDFKLCEN